jgi:hypothetical protein
VWTKNHGQNKTLKTIIPKPIEIEVISLMQQQYLN